MRTIQASQTCSRACRISRPRAFTASHAAPVRIQQQQQQQRSVQVQLFKFGAAKPAEDTLPAKKRSDYDREDVDDYFSYMGILAVELNYDRMDAMLAAGIEPIDCILIYACEEGDTPKAGGVGMRRIQGLPGWLLACSGRHAASARAPQSRWLHLRPLLSAL